MALIAVCFMPWTYHADVDSFFNGFYSEKNVYGKPGKFFIIFSVICIATLFINKVWARMTHLFTSGLIVAYALKTYHLYTSSYNLYTPQKQWGIYALVILSVLSFVMAMLPEEKKLSK
jgi:hypothetical protein